MKEKAPPSLRRRRLKLALPASEFAVPESGFAGHLAKHLQERRQNNLPLLARELDLENRANPRMALIDIEFEVQILEDEAVPDLDDGV